MGRWPAGTFVASTLLLTASLPLSVLALGGVALHGVGTGDVVSYEYGFNCESVPFEVRAVYLPDNRGIASFSWWGAPPSCAESGGAVALGVVHYDLGKMPPLRYEAACVGNESSGLTCGFLFIGPYNGPGSSVSLVKITAEEVFWGSFLGV